METGSSLNPELKYKVKVALLQSYQGGIVAGGSLILVKNTKTQKNKVVSVGICSGLNPEFAYICLFSQIITSTRTKPLHTLSG